MKPNKSKWYAAMKKKMDVSADGNILYFGASSGSTVGWLKTDGIIFAVENSAEMAIPLMRLAMQRKNIAPVFASARDIDYLKKALSDTKIHILFQDIPSVDQVEILENALPLIDKKTKILFSLKTQSISQQDPEKTVGLVKEKLKKNFKILDCKSLEPYYKKHYFFVLKKA
ncbi:MAG: fibrillarin-like rRNA/tRNA 2'-O-methyltransferase [archaeon]